MTRKEAIKAIQNDLRLHHDSLSGEYRKALNMAIEALQAPEIVRCKDCKHRDENCGMGEHRWCRLIKMSTTPNDFCSYGGRREP